MRQIFFDIETTGFKYERGHRVVEIAAIEFKDGVPTGKNVHLYFNPEREVPPEVVKIHGLDNAFLNDKPKFKDTIGKLKEFVDGADEVLSHNGDSFDLPFMDSELVANGFPPMTKWDVKGFTDTLKVARAIAKSKKFNLDALCDRYSVDRSGRTSHGAVIDCELLAEVWYKMTASIDFNVPDTSKRMEEIQRFVDPPKLLVIKPTPQEQKREEEYIKTWQDVNPDAALIKYKVPITGNWAKSSKNSI